jgi:excisionase family DNA binding protein
MQKIDAQRDLHIPALTDEATTTMRELHRELTNLALTGAQLRIGDVSGVGDESSFLLSQETVALLASICDAMSKGLPVTLVVGHRELTTSEAADYLGVSRPFVVKEMDEGRLPHRKVGSHRRVLWEDVSEYARQMRVRQESALTALVDNAREWGLEDA